VWGPSLLAMFIIMSKQSRGLKIRFQLGTRVPIKVTTLRLAVRCTIFKVGVEDGF
jgi:hypothetical protein